MIFSTKAASFLSSIKTQTYDKKEREMIITYQQKRVFHLSLLMLVLCAPIYIYSVPFPNEQFYYINSVLFLFIIMCTLAYFKKRVNLTTTFSYSVDQGQLTLTEREYGEQMVFERQ